MANAIDLIPSIDLDHLGLDIGSGPDVPLPLVSFSSLNLDDTGMDMDALLNSLNVKTEPTDEAPATVNGANAWRFAADHAQADLLSGWQPSASSSDIVGWVPTPTNNDTASGGVMTSAAFQEDVKPAPEAPKLTTRRSARRSIVTTELDWSPPRASDDGNARRRRRVRNAKQQELNRLAQQRYRERKKQKYTTLQSAVGALSGQLEELRSLTEQNNALYNSNHALEQALEQCKMELEAQKQLAAHQQKQLEFQEQQLRGTKCDHNGCGLKEGLAMEASTVEQRAFVDEVVGAVKQALEGTTSRAEMEQQLATKLPESIMQHLQMYQCLQCRDTYARLKRCCSEQVFPVKVC